MLDIKMSANHIRTVVESFYTDIWNRHNKSKIPALLCPDFTFRGSLGQEKTGHAGFASARMRFSGIHRGDFFGYSPTGSRVEWTGTALFTFWGGQFADLWVLGDVHGLLQLLERNARA